MKRRLNKKGKILVTSLVIIASIIIYILTAQFGAKANESTIYLIGTLISWIWLFFGQSAMYFMIWERELGL